MKKLFLLLLLITFNNVSYASFPVTGKTESDVVELIKSPSYGNSQPVWSILSLTCAILSLGALSYPLASTIIALLGVVFGAIGFNKKLKGLAITGFILSLLIFLVSAFITFVILLFGGDPTTIGG